MKLRSFVTALAAVCSCVVVLNLIVALAVQTHFRKRFQDLQQRTTAVDERVYRATIAFKKQVQEWKNVLLRGDEPQDLRRYWDAFLASEEKVREELVPLTLDSGPEMATMAAEALERHVELGKTYRRAKVNFLASQGKFPRLIDREVRGIDRELTLFLEQRFEAVHVEERRRWRN